MARGRRAEKKPSLAPWLIGAAVLAAIAVVAALLLVGPGADDVTIQHVHGLAVNPDDPSMLYVATHHGLFRLGADGSGAARIGTSTDDFMGFSLHPENGSVAWASGHPSSRLRGNNLGVIHSTDGGRTWSTIALDGDVDFHSMGVHLADPQRLFGGYQGKLYLSADGGRTWAAAPAPGHVTAVATPPDDADLAYLGVHEQGVRAFRNGSWEATRGLAGASPLALAVDPHDATRLWAGLPDGLRVSVDRGVTWTTLPLGGAVTALAPDPATAGLLYAGTGDDGIHRSADHGATWTRIR